MDPTKPVHGNSKEGAPPRSAARLAAVQALYQMETAGQGVEATIREFTDHRLGGEIEAPRRDSASDLARWAL